jgi:hypothetical protein
MRSTGADRIAPTKIAYASLIIFAPTALIPDVADYMLMF